MTGPRGSRERLLDVARGFIGVTEEPFGSNCQRFSHDLGRPCEAWCADFACDCARLAGVKLPGTSAYTPTLADSFRHDTRGGDVGRFGQRPSVGAFVFFQWPGWSVICHVGIVEAIRSDGSIVTIEGNTDTAGGGSGGRVMRQVRRAYIVGYGYPRYPDHHRRVLAVKAHHHRHPQPAPRRLTLGDHGHDVARAQQLLNRAGVHPALAIDGAFGPRTFSALKAFEAHHGLEVNGILGAPTLAVLLKAARR